MQTHHAGTAQTRPAAVGPCIVMACDDQAEADQIALMLERQGQGALVTYRKAEDLVHNAPRGKVAVVIIAGHDSPGEVTGTLRWLNRRWPHCPVTVVGTPGDRDLEVAARTGGASYLVRPVQAEEWSAVLSHGMARAATAVRGA